VAGESKDGGSSIPYSGIVGAIMVAAVVVAQNVRLDSARPPVPEAKALASPALHQDVEARLWQDPFLAVAQYRERERQRALEASNLRREPAAAKGGPLPPDDRHSLLRDEQGWHLKGWLDNLACEKAKPDTIRLLMPMLPGGRGEEAAEVRRRTRYAVMSGLMNSGFNPDDSDAIGYAYVPAELRHAKGKPPLPELLPFEWFGRGEGPAPTDWVVVLWLSQDDFFFDTVAQVRRLVDELAPACLAKGDKRALDATVLGPFDSELLKTMKESGLAEALASRAAPGTRPPTLVRFVSATVTASILPSQHFLQSPDGSLTFARVVGPDARLAAALGAELGARTARITLPAERKRAAIVINEHDTDYGRGFLKELGAGQLGLDAVETFSYLRQIDGGRGGGSRARPGPERERDAEKSEPAPPAPGAGVPRAHGASQIDYLKRLVDAVKRYAEGDERADRSKRDIVAIGVFGNDVYDKLLILRALKPAFPKAVFMTTDLDARLLDPDEAPWARNLVVASNFGLSLSHAVQSGAAPFRDGYQTATYLVAWLYGGGCVTEVLKRHGSDDGRLPWLTRPLLFEIGRERAIPLEAPADPGAILEGCRFPGRDFEKGVRVRIQQEARPPVPRDNVAIGIAAAVVLGLLLWWTAAYPVKPEVPAGSSAAWLRSLLVRGVAGLAIGAAGTHAALSWLRDSPDLRGWMSAGVACAIILCVGLWFLREGFARRKPWGVGVGMLLCGCAAWLVGWSIMPALTPNAEPFTWIEGVSVWPTQLLRAVAAVFGGFALWHIGAVSAHSIVQVGREYGVAPSAPASSGSTAAPSMAGLWRPYQRHRSLRVFLTIIGALGYFGACVALMIAMDARPGIPLRGDRAPEVAALLGFAVFIGIVLLVSMLMACGALILGIVRPASGAIPEFPAASVREFARKRGLGMPGAEGRRLVEAALTVDLVAERSEDVTRLIYLPFLMFALMVAARSAIFDNWDTPAGLALVLGLPFVAVVGCVIWLRFATARLHLRAADEAADGLLRLRGADGVGADDFWKYERIAERLREERRGAFQILALQPMVRALLYPIGGFSGIELIEQFVLNR